MLIMRKIACANESMSASTATVIMQAFMDSAGGAGVVLASTGTIVVLSAALASSSMTCQLLDAPMPRGWMHMQSCIQGRFC